MTQSFDASGVSRACPDIDTLADLQAGVLDATTADAVRRHADACADCTELLAALDATVDSLAAMPEVQIPDDVARRIDAALAAEAGRIAQGDAEPHHLAAPTSPATVHDFGAHRASDAAPAQTGAVPAQGNGSAVASLQAHRAKRAGRGRILLAAAAAAAVIGGGALAINQAGSGGETNTQAGSSTGANGDSTAAPKSTGATGSVQSFAEPKDVLDKGSLDGDSVSSAVAGEMAQRTERLKCLSKITPRPTAAPEAVQAGKYKGTPAYAFIFPTDDPQVIEMIVVDAADCSTRLATEKGPRN